MEFDLREQLGQTLGDRYVIERELSPGGMSRLYLATEPSLDRKVVIKLLPPETASEVSAARFHREVLVAAGLQHPHILPVLSTGTSGDLVYYIMPYVAGESLRHRLEQSGKFTAPDALRVLREIADALALAHDRGIVHRDIKPANILLLEGHAVLTDFGIARAVEEARLETTAERLTATGSGIGTPGYMAPEQLSGDRDLDPRADVYALGVVGYEMFAGAPPFSRASPQALVAAHMTEDPPLLTSLAPGVPPALSAVIAKALAKNPAERYANAAELRDALDVSMTAAFEVALRPTRRKMASVVVAAAVLVLAAAAAGVYARVRGSPLDADTVVILPFTIRNADASMREGMVDGLHEAINGQGWVKSVPPNTYLRTFKGNADESSAVELGRRVGAALAIIGSVAATGTDSVAISAAILDVARGSSLGVRWTEVGPKDDFPRIFKALVRDLRGEFTKWKPIAAFNTTWVEEANPSALRAFLVGEQFFRRSAWDSATAYYERALSADSTFALAYRRAGLVVAWRRTTDDSLSRAYLRAAGRFNHGLPARDSLLISADSLRASLTAFESDTGYFGSVRRLFHTLRIARDRFPSDPEVWYALGDAYWHYGDGPGLSVSEDTILAAFDRSIMLDSGFTPAYIHAIETALTRDGREEGLRYADRYLALEPTDEEADGIRVLVSVLRAGTVTADVARILDTLSMDALQSAWMTARRWVDSEEVALRFLQLPVKRRRGTSFLADPGVHRVMLVQQLAYRGHFAAAFEALGTNIGPRESVAFGLLAYLGAVPTDTAVAVFGRLAQDQSMWVAAALPWWADRRDSTSLLAALVRARDKLARATSATDRRDWNYRVAATRAYLSLARNASDAPARFQALPDSLCMGCYLDRLTKARILDSIGRRSDAKTALDERLHTFFSPVEVAIANERARVAEKLGHYGVATRAYELVARAWSSGDAGPRSRALQAAIKAEQLGGDQPQRVKLTPAR